VQQFTASEFLIKIFLPI